MCTSFSAFKKTCILHSAAYRCSLQYLLIKTHRKTHTRRCNTHWNYTQMNSWKLNSGTESKPGLRLARATPNVGWSCSSVVSLAKEVAVRDAGGGSEGRWCQHQQTPCPALLSTRRVRNCTHRCSLLPLHFPLQLHHLHSSTFSLKSHTCFYTRQPQNPLTSMTPLNLKPRNKTPDTLKPALPVVRVHFCYIWLQK